MVMDANIFARKTFVQDFCKTRSMSSMFFFPWVVWIIQLVLQTYYPKTNLLQKHNLSFVAFELGFSHLMSRASPVWHRKKTQHIILQSLRKQNQIEPYDYLSTSECIWNSGRKMNKSRTGNTWKNISVLLQIIANSNNDFSIYLDGNWCYTARDK